jgi:hypothetical protein
VEPLSNPEPPDTMRKILAVAGALALISSAASAQDPRPLELGIDAGVTFGLDDPNVTVIGIPVQNFRMGFMMNDRVGIEPSIALNSIRADGDNFTTYSAAVGVLWHFTSFRSGPYFRPFIGVSGFSGDEIDGVSQVFVGAGIGLKIPVVDGRLAWRLEGNFAHAFDDGDVEGGSQIGLLAGLSFFTR